MTAEEMARLDKILTRYFPCLGPTRNRARAALLELYSLARAETLEEAAKIAEHFANDNLTAEEWPPHGLYKAGMRFDFGHVKLTGEMIAKGIRRALLGASRYAETPIEQEKK